MIHLGDITKLSGHNVPIVDCVIGDSPCQGMSVAGKMEGLNDDRSVLFYDQVRIAKEMREQYVRNTGRTDNIRPRYMVWENVAGAISVGTPKGEDFRLVLEEIAKIKDENAVIPRPPKGKWSNAGCIMGNGFSIAWRVCDNQFWGTPQRRRRIALVADFGGESAPEILFVRKSLSGNPDESQPKGQRIAPDPKRGVGADDRERRIGCDIYNGCITGGISSTIGVNCGKSHGRNGIIEEYREPVGVDTYNQCLTGSKAKTLNSAASDSDHLPCVCYGVPLGFRAENTKLYEDVVISIDRAAYNQGKNAKFDIGISEGGIAHTLVAKGPGGVCYSIQGSMIGRDDKNGSQGDGVNEDVCFTINTTDRHAVAYKEKVRYIVRRLTPLECERLQGFPDLWTDIGEWTDFKGKKRKSSDASRYKALGNSIALPAWKWIIKRISAQYERDTTMASLFDGIGGFPLLWEQLNGKGSCLWASEIEEFPIAVTKKRIGGD